MSPQKTRQQKESLGRFLLYVMGHRPDEFGLVPDEEGFVPVKDLLCAVKEEDGWSFVRESHIQDLLRTPGEADFEIQDKLIRVAPGKTQLRLGPPETAVPPTILYHAARRKGYPVVLERGLMPGGGPWVYLFTTKEMALRVGRRRDPEPVLLTVHGARAAERGVTFYRPQELIYLVESLAPDLFTGPPLPKERPEPEKKKPAKPAPPADTLHPGSFFLDPDRDPDTGRPRPKDKGGSKKGDGPDWKRAARKERRRREKF